MTRSWMLMEGGGVLLTVLAAIWVACRAWRERRRQARADALWRAYSERGLQ